MPRKTARKKKEEELGYTEIMKKIWRGVDKVLETGKGFSVEDVERYYKTGLAAKEEREGIRKAAPKPAEEEGILSRLVFRKVKKEKKTQEINALVTREAYNEAAALADLFEKASTGKQLNIKKGWIKKEAVA